jgi:hypothetical protein
MTPDQILVPAIGICGTLLGVIVSGVVAEWRERAKDRRDKYLIGTVIYQELWDQSQSVALCANYVNSFNRVDIGNELPRLSRYYLDHYLPAEPLVYRSLASRLHLLGRKAGTLVACYCAIEEAKRSTAKLPEISEQRGPDLHADVRQNHAIMKWCRASQITAEALYELKDQVSGPDGPAGPAAQSNLIGNLRTLGSGATITHDIFENPGS